MEMLVFCILYLLQTYYQSNNLTGKYNRKNDKNFRICIKYPPPPPLPPSPFFFIAIISHVCVGPDELVFQYDLYMFLRAFYASWDQ